MNSNRGEGCDINSTTKRDFFLPQRVSVHLKTTRLDRIRTLLNRIGLSQNKLADEVGISRGTMSKISNGDWYPYSDLMVKICKILECPTVVVFGDSKHWEKWNDKIIYGEGNNE